MPMSSFTMSLLGAASDERCPAAYSTARMASTALRPPRRRDPRARIRLRFGSSPGVTATSRTVEELALDDALDDPLLAHLDVAHLDLIARLQLGEVGHGAVLDGHRELHGLAVHHVLQGHGLGRLIHRHELAGEVLGGRLGRIRGGRGSSGGRGSGPAWSPAWWSERSPDRRWRARPPRQPADTQTSSSQR